MQQEIIIAGFGGQGVLSMGKILAYAGLMEGKEVTWMPAYGPEQRGGTANVTVIVSDEPISSPILSSYDTAIVLNQPSLDKFQPLVKPGGTLIYDSYGILDIPTRTFLIGESRQLSITTVVHIRPLGLSLRIRHLWKLASTTILLTC